MNKPDSIRSNHLSNIRLQKLIARYGYSSRRKAEELIMEGRVAVNGVFINSLGTKVSEDSIIEIDGRVINKPVTLYYLMLNKPPGWLCSRYDSRGRPLIYDLIDRKYIKSGVFTIGRLDFMSEGLILLTNDGDFAQRVGHPSGGIEKRYLISTAQDIPYNLIDTWKNGVYIKGKLYRIIDYERVSSRDILITLREGKNREIRKLFSILDIKIHRLKRVAIGPLELGNLPPGRVRVLSKSEIEMIENWGGGARST
ncbi:MAG: pseudouridine synthase [Spirochaetota bacterium]